MCIVFIVFHCLPFLSANRGQRLLLGIDLAGLEAVGLEEVHDGHSWAPVTSCPRSH